MKFRAWVLLSLSVVAVSTIPLTAQTCSSTSYTNSLICTLPQLFSPIGLTLPNPKHDAHFAGASQALLALPINQGTGQALATLPLGSSGSGTTFTLDAQGHPVPTEDSLGPILVGRANVIGKKAINLGVAYQYFNFSHLDGVRLSSFPAMLTHKGWTTDLPVVNPDGSPVFMQDYVKTINEVHLDLNQTVIYAVFGITNRMDASIELPIQSAHLRVVSTAHIFRTQPCEGRPNGLNAALGGDCVGPNDPNGEAECGEFHYFQGYSNTLSGNQLSEQKDCQQVYSSIDATFPSQEFSIQMDQAEGGAVVLPARTSPPTTDATGIGDITFRGKYQVIHREKLVGAVGLELRFPSGDAKNFLGTGAYGVTPFGALTYNSRISPHVRFGYEWNSNSVLAGDPLSKTGSSASLPAAWLYSGGADFRATKRLTIAADLIGQRVLDVNRLSLGYYQLLPETDGKTDPTTEAKLNQPSILVNSPTSVYNSSNIPKTSSYSSDAIAIGAKVRLFGELVLAGNATIRVDDGGLRANVVPLVGLSYAF